MLKYDIADSFAMAADIVVAGFIGPHVFTDIVDVNARNVNKSLIIKHVDLGIQTTLGLFEGYGLSVGDNKLKSRTYFLGGETADLSD